MLLTGKAAEAVRRKKSGSRSLYDAVVMDAPPTGRIGRFLNVTSEVSGLAKVGPIRGHADTVQNVIRSPQTAVHFVTMLEEMPVQETLDGIAELRGLAQRRAPARRHHDQHGPADGLPLDQLEAAAAGSAGRARAGSGPQGRRSRGPRAPGRQLAAELTEHARGGRWPSGQQRRRLAEAGQPRYDLPLITAGSTWPGCTGWPPRCASRGRPDEQDQPAPALDVDRLIDDRRTRIIVCCGSGGVGKTTTAAALGLRAAERGRHVVVLTVDPARRLAQSMGLSSLDNTPRPVPVRRPARRQAAACTR